MTKDKKTAEETHPTDNSVNFIEVITGDVYTANDISLKLKFKKNENNNEAMMQNTEKDAALITNNTEHHKYDIHPENQNCKDDCFNDIADPTQSLETDSLNNITLDRFNITPERSEEFVNSKDLHENRFNFTNENKESDLLDLDKFFLEIGNQINIDKLEDTSKQQANISDIEDIIDFVDEYNHQNNEHKWIKKEMGNPTDIEDKFICNKSSYDELVTDDVISISSESHDGEKNKSNDFIDSEVTNVLDEPAMYNKIEINIDLNEIETKVDKCENSEVYSDENSKVSVDLFPLSTDENSCCGYNSSDFEFITEDEAYTQSNEMNPNGTFKIVTVTQDSGFDDTNITSQNSSGLNYRTGFRNNTNSYDDYHFSINNFTGSSYRQNHVMPEGDGYLNLFQGHCLPTTPYMFEHKSTAPLYMQYEGIGFDMRFPRYDVDNEFIEEARENAVRILNMYPEENRRKRRYNK